MRIKIEGESDLDRLIKTLEVAKRQLNNLEWHNVNIYVTLKENGKVVEMVDQNQRPFEMLVFKNPTKTVQKQTEAPTPLKLVASN